MRGADVFVRSLMQGGIERLFTLSGNQIMPLFDACIDEPVELIHVRHEAAAVHMADAWGRLTGSAGVALVTAGPGLANALSALYVAWMAESPVVLVSGAAEQKLRGRGAFQELPQAELAGHVAKASWEVQDASQLGHQLARAVRIACSGRPGPVHLSVPTDVFQESVPQPQRALPQPDDFQPLLSLLDAATADAILEALAEATHPVILGGPFLRRGMPQQRLRELSATLNMPAVAMDSPRGIKDPSLGRFRDVLRQADVVLLLGRSLSFAVHFGGEEAFSPDCRFLMIDSDMPVIEQAGRNLGEASRLPITDLADSLPAIERLLQRIKPHHRRGDDWREQFETAVTFRPAQWSALCSSEEGPLHPAPLCRELHKALAEDDNAVFISDGGEFGQWAQACIEAPHRVINGPSGSIGGGIPFALAARLAFPQSRIIATLGDGTFGFHAMEFDTAVRHDLSVVVVVGNDACWNAERQIQLRDYGPQRLIGCDLLPARYEALVEALGGHGEFVRRGSEISAALQRAFSSGKPCCLNVLIEGVAAPE